MGEPGSTSETDPEVLAVRAARRKLVHFVVLLLAAVLAGTLPLPFQVTAIGFALAAVVVGVQALRRARVTPMRRAMTPLLLVGLIFTGLMLASMSAVLLVWPVQYEWQQCRAEALTQVAIDRCDAAQREALDEWLEDFSRRVTPGG